MLDFCLDKEQRKYIISTKSMPRVPTSTPNDDPDSSADQNVRSNAPKVRVRDYPIEVAGWENQQTRQADGHQFTTWNFVLQREYKNGTERVIEKMSIPAANVLQVATLLQKAYIDALESKQN